MPIGIDMNETKELEAGGITFVLGRMTASGFLTAIHACQIAADPSGFRALVRGSVRSWRGWDGVQPKTTPEGRLEQLETLPYPTFMLLVREIQIFHFATDAEGEARD